MVKGRWTVIGFLFVVTSINYLDRANLSVAAPVLKGVFHTNDAVLGIVFSAFSIGYAVAQMPAGVLVDRLGARVTYLISMVWWALASFATALVSSVGWLLGIRAILGIGEAPAFPLNARVVADWLPTREHGRASAWFAAGIPFGTAVAPPLVTILIAQFGWRSAFVVSGILSVVWAIVWGIWYRNPARKNDTSRVTATSNRVKWSHLFRYRNVWSLTIGSFCLVYVLFMFLTWLPGYLIQARHMTLLHTGFYSAIPWIFATIFCLLGGFISDARIKRGHKPLRARKTVMVVGMLFAIAVIPAAFVYSAGVALALISISVSGILFANGVEWAAVEDAAPPEREGSVGGIVNFGGNVGGFLAPSVTGLLTYLTHSFVAPLVLGGILALVGAAAYGFGLVDSEEHTASTAVSIQPTHQG